MNNKGKAPVWLIIFILAVAVVSFYFALSYTYQTQSPPTPPVNRPSASKPNPPASTPTPPFQSNSMSPAPPAASATPPLAPESPKPLAVLPSPPVSPAPGARGIAIIIDDFGYDLELNREFLKLPVPFTASVLPQLKYSTIIAGEARAAGKGVMLHLPMQPISSRLHPGPGAITAVMDDKAIAEVLQADLTSVPGAEGINNHEGSLITQDQLKMQSILNLIKQRELFFVDSLTTSNSVAGAVAAELGLRWNQRTVFLDNKTDEAYIAGQLKELMQHAAKTGSAIGICHTRPGTLTALQALAPELERSPVPLVLVKDLVR